MNKLPRVTKIQLLAGVVLMQSDIFMLDNLIEQYTPSIPCHPTLTGLYIVSDMLEEWENDDPSILDDLYDHVLTGEYYPKIIFSVDGVGVTLGC